MNQNKGVGERPEKRKRSFLAAAPAEYFESLRDGKNLFLLWAFLIPAGLLLLFYISRAVFPLGDGSVLILDLNGQYVSFFEELRDKLLHGGSLLYSWSRTLGGEFLGIFAYYLASPFSLIVCLFPSSLITEALLLMFMLKAGSCGFTMALYLRSAYPGRKSATIAFSTLYALSSYAIVQAHNTMWIDELIFLPLLVLGVERLIKEKKYLLYTVSLAYCAMSNFYIGYMVCIFTFFYFFYYYFITGGNGGNNLIGERRHFIRSLGRMILFSVIALLIAAAVICPAYVSLTFGKTEFSTPDYTLKSKFDLFDLFARLFPASYDTVRPEGLPFIYCGVLTALMVPPFFASRRISGREKLGAGAMICLFVFSFVMSDVDIVWHGMQKPNWLNYRYSFMLIFLLIVLAYRAFGEIRETDIRVVGCTAAAYIILLAAAQKLGYDWFDGLLGCMLSVAVILIWLGVICAVRSRKAVWGASVLLVCTVCAELLFAGIYTEDRMNSDVSFTSRSTYRSFIDRVQPSVDMIKEYNAQAYGDEFYRTEKTVFRKTNDGMALGLYGISSSSSLLNAGVISSLGKLGIGSASNWTRYYGGNPVFDSLFSIRYLICEEESDAPLYSTVTEDTENGLIGRENPYALPLCYGVNEDILGYDIDGCSNPFERMNGIITAMLGEDETVEVWKPIKATAETENLTVAYTAATEKTPRNIKYSPIDPSGNARVTYSLYGAGEDSEIYAYFPSGYLREASVYVDGDKKGSYFDGESYSILSLGARGEDEELRVALRLEDNSMYIQDGTDYFWYLDKAVFESAVERLGHSGLEITSFSDTHIEGTVNAERGDRVMFTGIPYDSGWRVRIDGERAELLETVDCLLAFELPEGEHTVELSYLPSCVIVGCSASAVGIAALVGVCLRDRARRKRSEKTAEGTAPQKKS